MNKSPTKCSPGAAKKVGLTVFYDGSCPICAREIAFYKDQNSVGPITWEDASLVASALPNDLSRNEALRRFHVQLPDGKLVSGAAAFATLWQALPRFKMLGIIVSMPVLRTIAECGYRLFLVLRPQFQSCLKFLRT